MSLNHETTQATMVGSAGVTAGTGLAFWLTSNATLITLACVIIATLVTVFSFVLNSRLNLREDARKEAHHKSRMGEIPDKIEGTDNAEGTTPKT